MVTDLKLPSSGFPDYLEAYRAYRESITHPPPKRFILFLLVCPWEGEFGDCADCVDAMSSVMLANLLLFKTAAQLWIPNPKTSGFRPGSPDPQGVNGSSGFNVHSLGSGLDRCS